jgi:hypothetical protein
MLAKTINLRASYESSTRRDAQARLYRRSDTGSVSATSSSTLEVDPDVTVVHAALTALYSAHAPEKLSKVGAVADSYTHTRTHALPLPAYANVK